MCLSISYVPLIFFSLKILPHFLADISGAKKVMVYFQSPSIKENLEKCAYTQEHLSQAVGNDSLLFTVIVPHVKQVLKYLDSSVKILVKCGEC